MKYNAHFANHFGSCRLLVEGYDPHRQRQVQIRAIPGEFTVVGITDGVDCWVAPTTVAPSPLFDKVRVAMHALQNGTFDGPISARRRVLINDEPTPQAPPSNRILGPSDGSGAHPETPRRTRRALLTDI